MDTLIEVATLKTKLKFIDIQAKMNADLEKMKTIKSLEMARAKLETLDALQGKDNSAVFQDVNNNLVKSDDNSSVIDMSIKTEIPKTCSQVPHVMKPVELSQCFERDRQTNFQVNPYTLNQATATYSAAESFPRTTVYSVSENIKTSTSPLSGLNPHVSCFQPRQPIPRNSNQGTTPT